jgi:hypothetical protein
MAIPCVDKSARRTWRDNRAERRSGYELNDEVDSVSGKACTPLLHKSVRPEMAWSLRTRASMVIEGRSEGERMMRDGERWMNNKRGDGG